MKIKRLLLLLLKVVLSVIGLCLLYLGLAWLLSRVSMSEEEGKPDEMAIYILSNGVHTDIVVPAKTELYDWTAQVPYTDMPDVDSMYHFLAIGWGDKGFYLHTPTWADLKASVAFRAATGLSTTALHTTYYRDMQEGEQCHKIMISKDQYQRLITYIEDSADRSAEGRWINIDTDANYGVTDAFYEAKGSYSLFHTCNTWANTALKASGQKHCLWTPFDTGIFLNYK